MFLAFSAGQLNDHLLRMELFIRLTVRVFVYQIVCVCVVCVCVLQHSSQPRSVMRTEANVVKFYKKANTHNIFVPKLKVKFKIWSQIS